MARDPGDTKPGALTNALQSAIHLRKRQWVFRAIQLHFVSSYQNSNSTGRTVTVTTTISMCVAPLIFDQICGISPGPYQLETI
jgi:hypothetical protein